MLVVGINAYHGKVMLVVGKYACRGESNAHRGKVILIVRKMVGPTSSLKTGVKLFCRCS